MYIEADHKKKPCLDVCQCVPPQSNTIDLKPLIEELKKIITDHADLQISRIKKELNGMDI